MSKNLDEAVRLQSEKRQEWIREIRGKRLQGIAEGASSAPRLASSSATLFPGRNECPGTHCSLIEQEEREDSSCQICHKVKVERVKVAESCSLTREREIRTRAWRDKGGLHHEERQISRRKKKASKKSLPRTSRRKHEQVSGRKSSPRRSPESWFHSKFGQN